MKTGTESASEFTLMTGRMMEIGKPFFSNSESNNTCFCTAESNESMRETSKETLDFVALGHNLRTLLK